MSKDWAASASEPINPVPPLTKCVAVKDFKGEQGNDLAFTRGEILTIIDPCNVMYWYVAEKSNGHRGVIPITHVKVHSASSKKPPPLPPDSLQPATPPSVEGLSSVKEGHAPSPPLPPKPATSATLEHSSKPAYIAKSAMTYPRLAQGMTSSKGVHVPSSESSFMTKMSPKLPAKSPPSPGLSSHAGSAKAITPPPLPEKSSSNSPPPPLLPDHRRGSPPVTSFKQLLAATTNTSSSSSASSPSSTHQPTTRYTFNTPKPSKSRDSPPIQPSPLHSSRNQPLPAAPSSTGKYPVKPVIQPPGQATEERGSPTTPTSISVKQKQMPPLPHSPIKYTPAIDIDRRPPALLPSQMQAATPPAIIRSKSKYTSQKEFVHMSGWFIPSLEKVLCKMMYSGNVAALTSTTTGIYMFVHKRSPTKKYVGKSRTAYHDLVQMFHRLYDKKDERLSALEKEIKYNSPDASDWVFRIYSLSSADQLEVEVNRRILENNTLEPAGMNTEIRFSTKESFLKFAEAYAQNLRESAKKCVNPIRAAKSSH